MAVLENFGNQGMEMLRQQDPSLYHLLEQEYHRQTNMLIMVAAASTADPSVLACNGTVMGNITTEGYPGARFHAGCRVADEVERLAIERAKEAFHASYANVQPHSGTSANEIVLFSILKPGDTILGLELTAGGHLTHGARASIAGQYFNAVTYGLADDGYIDYDQVRSLASHSRPKIIICGASAYPRKIDFSRFREIADEVGAFLLADISHIAGLVVAGEHPSPIDVAHFTTTSTYKQLYGPRGGLILMGKDHLTSAPDGKRTLAETIQRAVFPFFQGTPDLAAIAAKARALAIAVTPDFKILARRIVSDASCLAEQLADKGYRILTGGSDNHLLLVDIKANGMTGVVAERALEECHIIVNRNRIAGDQRAALVTSGLRLGTNNLALRGMGRDEMIRCANLIHQVLCSLKIHGEQQYELDNGLRDSIRDQVQDLCTKFPLPAYPLESCSSA